MLKSKKNIKSGKLNKLNTKIANTNYKAKSIPKSLEKLLIKKNIKKFRKKRVKALYKNFPRGYGYPKFFDIVKKYRLRLIGRRRKQLQMAARSYQIPLYKKRYLRKLRNPKKIGYTYLFYKKSRNNLFLTVTNMRGCVISSKSAGHCGITTKKRKKSPDTLKAVASAVAKTVKSKKVSFIRKFICKERKPKIIRTLYSCFAKEGVTILQTAIIKCRPHGEYPRRRKLRRI